MHTVMVLESMWKLQAFISISLVLLDHSRGIFELAPSGEVYVCTGQNQFEVVCSSSASDFLEWNLTFPALNNFPYIRIISKTNVVGSVTPIKVESVEFMVTVTQNPLRSRASANQISPVLNGSMILCREQYQNAEIRGNSAEVVIHVVNSTTAGTPNSPVVQISSEQFGRNNVTVILEWPNGGGGVSYSASVTPEGLSAAEIFSGNGSCGIKLVLLYNTAYNLRTVATLCGVNSTASITELKYVDCGEPTTNPRVNFEYNSTLVSSQLLLRCEDGGGNVTILMAQCSESATWMPDPSELCPTSSEASLPPSSSSNASPTPTDVSEPVLESASDVKTNWMLIGICVSVGVLSVGGICVVVIILIIVTIIKRGCGHRQNKASDITAAAVEDQEKDINMSRNIIYEQVKCQKQKVVLEENVAYWNTSQCASSNVYSAVY